MRHKQSILILLALVVAGIFFASLPSADETAGEPISGTTGDCTWSLDGTVLTVSGKGDMGDYSFVDNLPWGTSITSVVISPGVTTVGDSAFCNCESLSSVTLSDDVISIGNYAFSGCKALGSILLPKNLDFIGKYAFYGCSTLASAAIPEQVSSIGNYAFSYCKSLGSVAVPSSVTTLGNGVFAGCSSLLTASLPEGITVIGVAEFEDCIALRNTNIPDSVTVIDDRAFRGCASLSDVKLPEGIVSIGKYAFYGCSSLTSITVPAKTASIGYNAFTGCSSLKAVIVPESNPDYASEDGILFNKEKTYLIHYPAGQDARVYYVPENVVTIGTSAFYGCTSLVSIILPESTLSVESRSFYGCTSLRSITVPSSNQNYASVDGVLFSKDGADLVRYPEGKTELSYRIPEGVTYIGYCAFENVSFIEVTIPSSVTYIEAEAFGSCRSLVSIALPDSVEYIGDFAFLECTSLGSLSFGTSVASIGDRIIEGCTSLTSITVPGANREFSSADGVLFSKDGKNLIQYPEGKNDAIYSVPEGVSSIGYSSFRDCLLISTVILPESLDRIGNSAFYGCTSLATVVNLSPLDIRAGGLDHGYVAYYASSVRDTPEGMFFPYVVNYIDRNGNILKEPFVSEAEYGTTVTPQVPPIEGYTAPTEGLSMTIGLTDNDMNLVYTVKSYTVTWLNYDGSVLATGTIEHGNVPEYTGNVPKRPDADGQYFEFISWSPVPSSAACDAEFVAIFLGFNEDGDGASVSAEGGSVYLPPGAVDRLVSSAKADKLFTFTATVGGSTVIFDGMAVATWGEGGVTLSLAQTSYDSLTEGEKSTIGDGAAYTIDLGPNKSFGKGTVTITVPYTLPSGSDPEGLSVWHISDGKKAEGFGCTYADGFVTFETNHFSLFAIMYKEPSGGSENAWTLIVVLTIAVIVIGLVLLSLFVHMRAGIWKKA